MKIAPLVAKHIEEVVHGNWTDIYLGDVIGDISFSEAVTIVPGTTNSIAMLVYHIGFYNGIAMERLKGNNPAINEANGLDIDISDDTAWQELKATCLTSFKQLAAAVACLPDEKLWEFTPAGQDSFYKTLHGISEHAHYHFGQIVLLKKIIRNNG
jgi:hypothetical protein